MAKERKEVVGVEVKIRSNMQVPNLRLTIQEDWDKKEPTFAHYWRRLEDNVSRFGEVSVKDGDDNSVVDGDMQLVRFPRDEWQAIRKRESDQSIARMKTIRTDDGTPDFENPLTRFASPKIKQQE